LAKTITVSAAEGQPTSYVASLSAFVSGPGYVLSASNEQDVAVERQFSQTLAYMSPDQRKFSPRTPGGTDMPLRHYPGVPVPRTYSQVSFHACFHETSLDRQTQVIHRSKNIGVVAHAHPQKHGRQFFRAESYQQQSSSQHSDQDIH